MKSSRIFLLALAVVWATSICALADDQHYSCTSTISFDTNPIRTIAVGETTDWIDVTLMRNDQTGNFTNIQFCLYLPSGLEVSSITNRDTDTQNSLSLTGNNHPDGYYIVIGTNKFDLDLGQIMITQNPLKLCRLKFKKTALLQTGASIIVKRLKYTDNKNDVYTAEDFIIDLGICDQPYDVNGDSSVDIYDVNAVINRMLGKNNLTNADVNGDGIVDIFDVNEVVNVMLGRSIGPGTTTYTVGGVSFKMVAVEGGTFTMGATAEQGSDAYDWEKPAHEVTLSSYSIGQTEVTQELWQAVMGSNPSRITGNLQRPVEQVSWNDCQTFISKLNQMTGKNFRLPTEAEWEYAARGGNRSQGYKYAGSNTIGDVAWCHDNSYAMGSSDPDYGTHSVATKAPNELGLYDMTGNVCEWCQDWYGSYSSDAQTAPAGPASGSERVYRGGGWYSYYGGCRVSYRYSLTPSRTRDILGLRLAL